jgi:preprotein translocase subunit SecG
METVQTLLMVVQVFTALALIGFILIQQGKGADAGAAFGSGASATVFGARGSGNFLSRTTTVLAAVFLVNSLALAWIAKERVTRAGSVMETALTAPAIPAGTPSAEGAAAAPAAGEATTTVPAAGDAAAPATPDTEVPAAPADPEVPKAPE